MAGEGQKNGWGRPQDLREWRRRHDISLHTSSSLPLPIRRPHHVLDAPIVSEWLGLLMSVLSSHPSPSLLCVADAGRPTGES